MAAEVCPASPASLKDLLNTFSKLKLSVPDTKNLMWRLGVELHTLTNVDARRKGSDRMAYYIQAWLDIELAPTWVKIIVGLRLMNMKGPAKQLAEMVGIDPKTITLQLPAAPLTDERGVIDVIEAAMTSLGETLSREEMRDLFRRLGVTYNVLDNIDEDHDSDAERGKYYAKAWLNVEADPSKEHIISGLQMINKIARAEQLEMLKKTLGSREKVGAEIKN
ncbi:hypothetical protein GBAR_LOCUS3114 [Geodia barretti]|uniref:Death domain-containing protein n=1 Tax=Geodia barretti TaxID=519541 RepID=A0AA35R1Y2_GEOBA|nr:hypothetical protein GBAR_LOCUS3114 [Geodia barretti]